MTKQQDISISGISISPAAQWKMALHATTKPRVVSDNSCGGAGGRPVFFLGIVLGHQDKSTTTSSSSLVITDVVPVCRETPTKPIVDMALRLVEAHLMKKKQQQTPPQSSSEGTKIIGFYTNSNSSRGEDDNEDEGDEEDTSLPNPVGCRILSSIAEASSASSSSNGAGGQENDGPYVLVSLSKSKLKNFITNKNNNKASLMILLCKAFQWETKSRTLARRKNVTIGTYTNDDDDDDDNKTTKEQRQSSSLPMVVYDFVDHLNDCDFVDSNWIENINN